MDVYEDVHCLDAVELRRMGDQRPVWTTHFCNWRSFTRYVKGVIEGTRENYRDWYAPAEWDRAVNELRRQKD